MEITMKFILIGDMGSGKTSLAWRFKHEAFKEFQQSSVGVDVQLREYDFFSNKVRVLLWDTAGQEKFQSIGRLFYRDCIGLFLCFDHGNRKSFNNIEKWINLIIDDLPDYASIILVGLKNDLEHHEISDTEAKLFSKKYHMKYYSVSAKTGYNVEKLFLDNVEQIYTDILLHKIKQPKHLGGIIIKKVKPKRRGYCWW